MRKLKHSSPSIQRLRNLNLRVGMLHSGGPAPGGNRVLAGVAKQFLDRKIPVIGFLNGYEFIQNLSFGELVENKHFVNIDRNITSHALDSDTLFLKTARANPGKDIKCSEDLNDSEKIKNLINILDLFEELRIGALISIGGDDTLKTANYIYDLALKRLNENNELLFHGGIVHVPKTIDNDYSGIAWTFGFFTAAESAGKIVRGLYDDAKSTNCYHVAELMGRKAGWYTAAASIYARGTKAVIPEDYQDRPFSLGELAEELVEIVLRRENLGKNYGVFCISEGLADLLSEEEKEKMEKDRHGNLRLAEAKIGDKIAKGLERLYAEKTGRTKSFKPQIVGYETRQISPTLYDALLTSQLGVGAFKLIERGRFGEMVTVRDNMEIDGIPFGKLIDRKTLLVKNRNIDINGDFYSLLRSVEEYYDE